MLVLVAVFTVALCGAALTFYLRRADSRAASSAAQQEANRKKFAPANLEERTRDTMLTYLAQPGFAGTKMGAQVLGPVRLELLQVRDREVYFSAPTPSRRASVRA
jgi:predicted small lipoprotein YifL